MARNDPTENGGLFIGRRPGTGPVRWRQLPDRGGPGRMRLDRVFAGLILVVMSLIVLSFWGPIPFAGLWVGSWVQYLLSSPSIGLLAAFIFCVAAFIAGLVVLSKLDRVWIILRRGGGYNQKAGVLNKIFVVSSVIGVAAFSIWLLLFSGAELAPVGIRF